MNLITYRTVSQNTIIEVSLNTESSVPQDKMETLLKDVGFSIKGFYSDYNYSPYESGEEYIVIAKK